MENNNRQNKIQNTGNQELMKLPTLETLQNKLSQTEVRTLKQALNAGFDSIAKIKRSYGETASRALVVEMVVELVQFVNVGKTMNANQIAETVKLIESYFPHLTLADLKLFFTDMKLGRYGKFFDRIDGNMILESLEQYNQERMNAVESANLEAHKRIKKYGYDPLAKKTKEEEDEEKKRCDLPRMIETMKSAVGERKQILAAPTEKSKQTAKDIVQRWMRQFDNLYNGKFGKMVSGMRFLVFGEMRYNLETFIERKFNNLEN